MNNDKDIFVVGTMVSGESFFGRKSEINELQRMVFDKKGAVSLVGIPRIGKSSLVRAVYDSNKKNEKLICAWLDMSPCKNVFEFLKKLANEIKKEIQKKKDLWNDSFENFYREIDEVDAEFFGWYLRLSSRLEDVLTEINENNHKTVLVIDEFDAVEKLFGQESSYYSFLRSIFYNPDYAASGLLISRRRLQLIETKCEYISSFPGIFKEMPLYAFNAGDMKIFYEKLTDCGIRLQDTEKEELEQYTGNVPYLCCMFADCMVKHLSDTGNRISIIEAFQECLPQINDYYENLLERLEEDGYKEMAYILSAFSKFPANMTNRDIENLKTMGVIIQKMDEEGMTRYCVYSEDFMTYLRFTPLKLPLWETMTGCEKKLKSFIDKEYHDLDTTTYSELLADPFRKITTLNSNFPELKLNANTIKTYCRSLQIHKPDPTILDVLTLSKVVDIINSKWTDKFSKYFEGNGWQDKFEKIVNIRNPMSHATIEYVSKEELAVCMKYCQEIINM